jgi:integrase
MACASCRARHRITQIMINSIDLANRAVTVRRTWGLRGAVGEARFNSPKSGKERVVDLTSAAVEAFKPVIPTREPTTMLWPDIDPVTFYYKAWRPLMTASGLPYRKPHALRHTYASLLLAKGVSVAYVQAQLGHHSVKVTVDTYGHFMPGARIRFVDQLDDITQASPPPVDDEAKAHKAYGVTTAGNSVRAAEERDISLKTRCSDTAVSCG